MNQPFNSNNLTLVAIVAIVAIVALTFGFSPYFNESSTGASIVGYASLTNDNAKCKSLEKSIGTHKNIVASNQKTVSIYQNLLQKYNKPIYQKLLDNANKNLESYLKKLEDYKKQYEQLNCGQNVSSSCTDFENAKDYYAKGIISGFEEAINPSTGQIEISKFELADTCSGSKVIEYFCIGNKLGSGNFECPSGCKDGACLKAVEEKSSVIITSPNGGEQLSNSQPLLLKAKISGVPSDGGTVAFGIILPSGGVYTGSTTGAIVSLKPSYSGEIIYELPATFVSQKLAVGSGYKVNAVLYKNDFATILASDQSDSTFSISSPIVSNPDLIVSDITFTPSNPKTNDTVTATVTVKNIGATDLSSSVLRIGIINNNPEKSADKVLVIWNSTAPVSAPLKPNFYNTFTFKYPVPGTRLSSGTYVYTAKADADNVISESNEDNNVLTKSFTVTSATQPTTQQTCTDGTLNNQCSTTKPKFCNNGQLVDRASQCGCGFRQVAVGDNCVPTCEEGTRYNQCSVIKPLFCGSDGLLREKASVCNCPEGHTISGDECLLPAGTTCTDSDGINYRVRGVVYTNRNVDLDYCINDAYVMERRCESGSKRSSSVICPNSCKDGACV